VVTWTSASSTASAAGRNALVSLLPPSEAERLLARMEEREVDAGETLFQPGTELTHAYFPENAVVSLLTTLQDGSAVETATIGREGMVGLMLFLGDDLSVNGRAVVQMPGRMLRLDAGTFRSQLAEGGKLPDLMLIYARALMLHLSQSTACGIAHPVRARLARWLLQTTDRTGSSDVPLTQQFLAEILGVRRASITEEMGELQSIGAVKTRRGGLTIVDRDVLLGASCECYEVVKAAYERLIPAG
jgi:CRP-like cAMP-binding protein